VTLSVVVITYNEEANIGRTLASVQSLVREIGGEIIVVDSGSSDRTREIAESFGAKVFVETWKGFAAQKNSTIDKASGDWVLLLDADEEVSSELCASISRYLKIAAKHRELPSAMSVPDKLSGPVIDQAYAAGIEDPVDAFWIARRNLFLGRWIKHGAFWPDRKLRLFRRGAGRVEDRAVHETVRVDGATGMLSGALIHHAYPTLEIYQEHMRRYAALAAEMIRNKPRLWLWLNRWLNPPLTFVYNYFFRLGFLDGRQGLLLHYHHSIYVSWKYTKALELNRKR
jgi:glycosyltransferase involved in cell wall biosynthesis